ncbi:HEAT repeat domain-containing protein [Planctomycetota bacterium]
MAKPRTPEMKWRHGPQALADRADEGFLFVVRSTGKALGGLSSGIVKDFSKIGQVLAGTKKNTLHQQTEPLEAAPPEEPDREMQPAQPQCPPLDVEALLEEHSPQDADQAATVPGALEDLLHGSKEDASGALMTLVGLGQVAEPLLVACLQTGSPRLVEIALEGLSRIDSGRLAGCISDVLESPDMELRFMAVGAAGRLPDEQQQPLLERGLRDPCASVRRRALACLSRHDSYWAAVEVRRLCDDKEPDVQWAAVEAMMAMKPSDAHRTLRLMKPSLTPAYQRRAAVLLGQRKDHGTAPEEEEKEPWERQ